MPSAHPKILLASSNGNEKQLLSRHLRSEAYKVIFANNGRGCSRRLYKQADLLLLDLSIDHSWEILKRVKKGNGNGQDHKIPVVVFDPGNDHAREVRALRLGANGYIGRPKLKLDVLAGIAPFMERKKVEDKLQALMAKEIQKREAVARELKRLSSFVDNISSHLPVSIVIVDRDRKITFANRNFCRAQGWEEKDLRGLTLERFFPEAIYGPIGFLEKVETALECHRAIHRFGMQFRGENYTCRIVPVRGTRGHENKGDSAQAMILIENVSELKELGEKVKVTEEKYRLLFESAPDGILVTRGRAGRIIDANRQAERLLGKTKGALRQRSLMGFYPPEQKGIARNRVPQGSGRAGPIELPELVLGKPGPSQKILTVTVAPILHQGERALLCLLKDTTEKRFLEDQVRQGEKMSLLGQFTAGAAHEINNPLAIISSNCQYLLSRLRETGKPDHRFFSSGNGTHLAEIRDTLDLIDRESRHCGGIIKNLLAYTHTHEVVKKEVSLPGVVEETLKMVKHQLALSNVDVQTESTGEPLTVLGDANLLQQVLMNLVWNAQAAMPNGGKLNVGVFRSGHGTIELSVRDTGSGIPRGNLEKIFTPFFTTKEVGKGTGLGLWVVRSIVEEHQGNIEVQSRVKRGTRFTVNLPAIAPSATAVSSQTRTVNS